MDIIKFKLFYDPNARLHADIIINGQNLAARLMREEHRLVYQGKIDGVWTYGYAGLPPEELVEDLFKYENPDILGAKDWDGYGYRVIRVTTHETENSIIWSDIRSPRRRVPSLSRESFLNDNLCQEELSKSKVGLHFPTPHFEFDKKQYYQAIGKLIEETVNREAETAEDLVRFVPWINKVKVNNQWMDEQWMDELFCQNKKYYQKNIKFYV
jgi:hypothetical protein